MLGLEKHRGVSGSTVWMGMGIAIKRSTRTVRGLPPLSGSPLREVRAIHFGRWSVMPRVAGVPGDAAIADSAVRSALRQALVGHFSAVDSKGVQTVNVARIYAEKFAATLLRCPAWAASIAGACQPPQNLSVPIYSTAHGDLTLENLIVTRSCVVALDRIPSYIQSRAMDYVKLRQDLVYGWFLRFQKEAEMPQCAASLLLDVEQAMAGDGLLPSEEALRWLDALNLLRIAPYVKGGSVEEKWLKEKLRVVFDMRWRFDAVCRSV